MNSSSWSSHSKKFNSASGQSLTFELVFAAFEQSWFKKMDESISAKQNEPIKVLALGCGTGAEVEAMCSRYNKDQIFILATDYAEGMVEATKDCVERIGAQDRVKVQVMDAMNINLENSTFDIITLILGPMLMPDPSRVFQEIQRVLVPGGWSAHLTPSSMETHDILNDARRRILEESQRSQDFSDFYKGKMMKEWGSPEVLAEKLQAANFSKVESILVKSNFTVERGAGIDEMMSRIFDNPGMSQLYEGGLSPEEVKTFRKYALDKLHSNWPPTDPPSPAKIYSSANAAVAYKAE